MFTFGKKPLFIGISAVNIEVNIVYIKSKFLLYESDAQHRLHENIYKPQITVITEICNYSVIPLLTDNKERNYHHLRNYSCHKRHSEDKMKDDYFL